LLRRFSANHTHLYPGAFLRPLDGDAARLSAGDDVLVEFSDGAVVSGHLLEADPDAIVLQMPTYRTRRGTEVEAKAWRVVVEGAARLMRVQKRVPMG